MATSTSYNAAYVGVAGALLSNRGPNIDAELTLVAATANTIALQIQTALSNPSLSAAKQAVLTQVVLASLTGRYTDAALGSAEITRLAAAYAALTANVVD
jgi:hypothetical protein